VLASTVPLLIFAAVMTTLFERQQRASVERGLRDTARALTVAVDHELFASISVLQTLAASEPLETGNLGSFYTQAQRVVKAHPGWRTINVFDRSGQHILSLLRPLGTPLPFSGDLDVVRRTLATGQPVISDVYTGRVAGVPTVAITVPVTRDGRLTHVLAAGLAVRALSDLLAEGKLPGDRVATIVDGQGRIAARTRDIERWLGQPASAELVAQTRGAADGSFRHIAVDGVSAYTVHTRSRLSGWTIAVSVPVAVVDGPRRLWVGAILGGGLLALVIAAACAVVVGGRIAREIAALSLSPRAGPGRAAATAARTSRIA